MRDVDQYGYLGLAWRLQHRHGNEWVELRENVAEPDEEDGQPWGGRSYVCPVCDEEVRVLAPGAEQRGLA
jgi:hypothetical protein